MASAAPVLEGQHVGIRGHDVHARSGCGPSMPGNGTGGGARVSEPFTSSAPTSTMRAEPLPAR